MQSSSAPPKFPIPFANGASPSFIRAIPQASQIGTQKGAASLFDGFPPITFDPVATGGVPPFGQDFNGILYWLSAAIRWLQAGVVPAFDLDFCTAIGGYPKGAILQSADGTHLWRSTAENNSVNPDGLTPTGWVVYSQSITSVFGRTGAIGAQTGDYSVAQISGAVPYTDFIGGNQLLGAFGYQRLAGGLLLQWTAATVSGSSSTTIAWPTTFPNACFGAVTSALNALPSTPPSIVGLSRFNVAIDCASGGDTPYAFVFGIGF